MAVEYHLITCLGRDGVSVTVATTGVVTLANHGMRAGHPIRMTATTFPGGAAANTTYYVSATDLGTGSFKVSATNGGAPLTFSSTGSEVKVIGEYWATLPATDPGNWGNYRARYGSPGSERVYNSLVSAATAINAMSSNYFKHMCIEVVGAWTDFNTSGYADFSAKWKSLEIVSKINGIRSSAFHHGVRGSGYIRSVPSQYDIALMVRNYNAKVDGLECVNSNPTTTADNSAIRVVGANSVVINNIVRASVGIQVSGIGALVANNIAVDCSVRGFFPLESYAADPAIYFGNLACKCGLGFYGTYVGATFIGNVSVGNTTNWDTAPTLSYLANNIGEPWNSVWGGAASLTTGSTSMFVDYANDDFRPSSVSAVQVELIAYTDGDGLPRYDITDAVRPSYINATTDKADAGPFEFDHGNGLAPAQVEIVISGMAEGSVMAVYKTSDGSVIVSPTTIGASGAYSTTYSYTGDTQVEVVVRKGTSGTKYLPYSAPGLITANGFSLIVNQVVDGVLNG